MAQLNDLIVNGYTRFLNSAYGNLNGSATSALCAAYAAAAGSAPVASHSITSTAHSDTGTFFSGNSARSACSATSAKNAGTADNALKVYHSAWNANSARAVAFTETASGYSQIGTAADFTYNPSTKLLSVVSASATNVRGVTVSATNVTAATTVRGTNISGTNISGATKTATIDDLITSASRAIPTVNNKTITITTGASPATGSFSTNTADNKTITLGSMALKASGDYSLSTHNHYLSALNGTATYFSGTTAAPSALSALTSKSALSAGSATKAATATYDSAGNVIDTTYGKKINDVYYVTAGYNATTYPNYDTTKTYATGAYIVTGSRVYSASAAVTVAGSWASNSSKFTTASTTVVWSGNTTATSEVTALTAGLKISLKVPSNMSGAATTQLNLNSLGAKTIRRNNGNLTTHLPFGTIVYLTYDGTYWVWADYDSNSDTKVRQNRTTANSAYPIIMKWNNTTATGDNTVNFNESLTYNPSTRELKITASNGEDSVSITPTHLSCTYGEMAFPCTAYVSDIIEVTSYFTNGSAKKAVSAGTAFSSKWTSGSTDILRPISFANANASAAWNGNSAFNSDQVYSKYFLFNPAYNVLQVGNLTTDRNNQGGIYTNYINSLNLEVGHILGTQVYFSDDKNYVGSEIVQIGGVGVKSTSASYTYKPQLRLDFGTACSQDSTYSSDVPKIMFLGGNGTASYNCTAALAFSYYNTPMRFGSTANHVSLNGGWFDFTISDVGEKNAGVLADCFSATSGYFSNNYVNDVHILSSLHISADELWVPDYFYIYASPNTEDGKFVLSGKLSADRVSAEVITTTTASIGSATFAWTSATSSRAELFTGTSGKFTNISATNITGTNISAVNKLSGSTAYLKTISGTSAKYTDISATNISAGALTRLFACGGIADHWTGPTSATLAPMNQFLDKTSNIAYIMPTGADSVNTFLTVNVTSLNLNDGDHNPVFEVHYYSPYAYPNGNNPLRITVGNFPAGDATSAYIYYDKGNVTATSSQRFYSATYVKTNGTTGFDLYLGFSGAGGIPSTSVISKNHIAQFYYSSGQHRLFIHCYG